jgi:hypothetical protein
MSRASIRRAVKALPPQPPSVFERGYEHALQFSKFYPVAPAAGSARARMQYPGSLVEQDQYFDGWVTAAQHLRQDRAAFAKAMRS